MPHFAFPGVGERIKERLSALGYGTVEQPDIGRFIKEKRYDGRYFYPWVKGRTPTGDYLLRLAADLGCSRAWLLLGEGPPPRNPIPRRKPVPIAGGSSNDGTIGVGHLKDGVLLIRLWLWQICSPWYPSPTWPPRLAVA